MLLAVMSDTHDHIWNLRKALQIIQERKGSAIVHCGDFVAPFMLKEFNQVPIPVHGVFGNNDGDQYLLTKMSLTDPSNVQLHGLMGEVALGGFKVAFSHYRAVADGLAASGQFDLVCFGHSHEVYLERREKTDLLNPGEVMGKDGSPGFYFVDTEDRTYEAVSLA
jgi:putative phosphoesterase